MKPFLIIAGFLSAALIISQLVLGLMILEGRPTLIKSHQHTGYLTVVVSLIYIGWSMVVIARSPKQGGP
jgi:hypothetical protein